MKPNYTTPHAELVGLLIDHWPENTSLTNFLAKFNDRECIALEHAIKSHAAFQADMKTEADNTPHIAEVF